MQPPPSGKQDFGAPPPVGRAPRPLPVLVLADVSGSMGYDSKIEVLNRSIRSMIRAFAEEDTVRGELQIAVITFGGSDARVHQSLAPANQVTWQDMEASGRTPMGQAFDLVRELLEDKEKVPERAYRAIVVLVSDGAPTPPDSWREPLDRMLCSDRAGAAVRVAVGIGADRSADAEHVLRSFSSDGKVLRADEVGKLSAIFEQFTTTVTTQLRAGRPVPRLADLDEL
ncbi:MAG: VWA domain-containing protein [Actinobacteria bacterium]|nr:VWA domain-containing protein [Actinomycetota bacterium]